MKTLLLIPIIWALCLMNAGAQVTQVNTQNPPNPTPNAKPAPNPNQLPNYYQNNSSFSNNSMQTNKPSQPINGSYIGNGNYVDPTRPPAPNTVPQNGYNNYLGNNTGYISTPQNNAGVQSTKTNR